MQWKQIKKLEEIIKYRKQLTKNMWSVIKK